MASPDDTKDEPTGPQLHPFYCWGDVHLLSSDNILFVCDSRSLTRSSTVFRDMVETAQGDAKLKEPASRDSRLTGGSSKESPIEMGEPSALLVLFLNMLISQQNVIDLLSVTPNEIAHIVRLCDKFDCATSVVANIKKQVLTMWTRDPWQILIIASHLDDTDMGVDAIKLMGGEMSPRLVKPPEVPGEPFWSSVRKMTDKWQAALLRACLSTGDGAMGEKFYRPDSTMRAEFSPVPGVMMKMRQPHGLGSFRLDPQKSRSEVMGSTSQ